MWAVVIRTRVGDRVAFCKSRDQAESRMRDFMLLTIQAADNTQLKRAWERVFNSPMRHPSNLEKLLDGGHLDSHVRRLAHQLTVTRWTIRRVRDP